MRRTDTGRRRAQHESFLGKDRAMKEEKVAKAADHAERGSITVYMALSFAVIAALISGSIMAVKVQAGRMQAANGADQSLYSLMAHYDREVFEKFGIFCINAENGENLALSSLMQELEEDISYILKPNKSRAFSGAKNLIRLENESTALTGYTLLTDAGGRPFEEQAVQCMKDTQALTVISRLENLRTQSQSAENQGNSLLRSAETQNYADIENASAEAAAAAAEEGETQRAQAAAVPAGFENPIPVLERLKTGSLLDLVTPGGVSDKSVGRGELTGGSPDHEGMGVIRVGEDASGGTNRLLYIEYILEHFGSYRNPSDAVLSYQMEYILCGKRSDRDNLKAAVRRILLMREGLNMTYLFTDGTKRAELESAAAIIATMLMVPGLEPAIRFVLAACWAFAESVVDVRALLEGKHVPMMKSAGSWQTTFESLMKIGTDAGPLTRDTNGAPGYEEYLGMLFLASRKPSAERTLDMFQAEIRAEGGAYGTFRTDCCIDSVEVEFRIRSERKNTFIVSRDMCYREM